MHYRVHKEKLRTLRSKGAASLTDGMFCVLLNYHEFSVAPKTLIGSRYLKTSLGNALRAGFTTSEPLPRFYANHIRILYFCIMCDFISFIYSVRLYIKIMYIYISKFWTTEAFALIKMALMGSRTDLKLISSHFVTSLKPQCKAYFTSVIASHKSLVSALPKACFVRYL